MTNAAFTRITKGVNSLFGRLFIMGLGMLHVGLLMWEPTHYSNLIGGFNPWNVILLIWAMCTSMVVGVGFVPYRFAFKLVFNPYCSLAILLIFTAILLF